MGEAPRGRGRLRARQNHSEVKAMRRFVLAGLVMILLTASAPLARAMDMQEATKALFAASMERLGGKGAEATEFLQTGDWISMIVTAKDADFTVQYGFAYDGAGGRLAAWDDLFADGDAAAARIEGIAAEATYANAYSEYNRTAPVPRDNFALGENQLLLFYPPRQLSHFSGNAGALALYAYELDGFLKETVPLARGDVSGAPEGLVLALRSGALPGLLSPWAIGTGMQAADDALTLVDVPDYDAISALWHFEAPQMRGVTLLSDKADDRVQTAQITGIRAERIDFYGLLPGISRRADVVSALGSAPREEADALVWAADGNEIAFAFDGETLRSITLSVAE